jgi:hypothetical protein
VKQITREDLKKLSNIKQIKFAVFCAKQVIHLVRDKDKEVCIKAISIVEAYLENKASKEDCKLAAYAAAADAAAAAAAYAAYAAAAADAAAAAAAAAYAAYAAYAAAADEEKIIEAQWSLYDQLLNGDKYFEEIVLNVKVNA